MTKTPAMPEPLGWYVVNNIGMATLCADEAEAKLLAEDCDMVYQRQAPHRAVQLVALAALQSAQPAAAEFNGWYCAHCQRGVDASEVTFHEQHTVCGRVITKDAPPAPQPAAAVSDAEIDRICYLATEIRFAKTDDAAQAVIDKIRAILARRPQAVPMTEDKLVACLVKANCIGVVKMSYDSGPYYVTRPSINASKLKEAIEAHHGITQRADGGEVDRG